MVTGPVHSCELELEPTFIGYLSTKRHGLRFGLSLQRILKAQSLGWNSRCEYGR